MAGRIPENLLEDILSRTDLVEVISASIPLKKSGANFKANCPFHHEKTPSFMVSPDKQIYHCFGCGESGNAFKFLMRHERMDFLEAVEALAKKAGVILPEFKPQQDQASGISTQIYRANELAVLFYQNELRKPQSAAAREYLRKRGISDETVSALKIGFAPARWDALIAQLRSQGISLSVMEKAGLIVAKEGGGYYDRFRNRILFPISDNKGRILGFGARVLDASLPKYINSPETPVYTKGKHLYGLGFSKDAICSKDSVIVVEGYLDFIMPYQAGARNIVASLGTALTSEQVRLLKRYTHNVVMIYDADAAGELATLRSLDLFIEEDMEVRIVPLPQGIDPDVFIRTYGVSGFEEKISSAVNLFDYKLKFLLGKHSSRTSEGKAKIATLMLETIGKIKNAVLKSEYIKKLAQALDVAEGALLEEVRKVADPKPLCPAPGGETTKDVKPPANQTEKLLLKLMLEEHSLIQYVKQHLEPGDFSDEKTSKIVSILFDLIDQGRSIEPRFLIQHPDAGDASAALCESMFIPDNLPVEQKERVVKDCIHRLKKEKIRLRRLHLHKQIQHAQHVGDEAALGRLVAEFQALLNNHNEVRI